MQILDTDGDELASIRNIGSIDEDDEDSFDDSVRQVFRQLKKDEEAFYGLLMGEPAKWYNHEDALVSLSKDFKYFVFVLSGEGEEAGDIWRKYFCGGKVKEVFPELIWPEFNIGKEFYGRDR